MGIKVIKLTKEHYNYLVAQIRENWGNVSIPRGIYLLQRSYQYVPKDIKAKINYENYQNKNKKRKNLR